MAFDIRPSIHAPYAVAIALTNLSLLAALLTTLPISIDLLTAHNMQPSGLTALFADGLWLISVFVAVLVLVSVYALLRCLPGLFHHGMAASLLAALFLLLTLFSATVLPLLKLFSVVSG